jgi:hypothetical protein
MTRDEVYRAWAPQERLWSNWVKPVLFAHAGLVTGASDELTPSSIDTSWALVANGSTAVVVDVPGDAGVWIGLALAGEGYAPVPLYNAIPAPPVPDVGTDLAIDTSAVVTVWPIVHSLVRAASALESQQVSCDAPPAFLLDANRAYGAAKPSLGQFDNRSISLPTDFPSANLLLSRGIRQIVLVQETGSKPQPDLAHTLLRWQMAGIRILAKSLADSDPPTSIEVERPSRFQQLWYRFLATLGLPRSPFGGFGGRLPMAGSSG